MAQVRERKLSVLTWEPAGVSMVGHVGNPSMHTGWKDWGRGKGALSKEGAGVSDKL